MEGQSPRAHITCNKSAERQLSAERAPWAAGAPLTLSPLHRHADPWLCARLWASRPQPLPCATDAERHPGKVRSK